MGRFAAHFSGHVLDLARGLEVIEMVVAVMKRNHSHEWHLVSEEWDHFGPVRMWECACGGVRYV